MTSEVHETPQRTPPYRWYADPRLRAGLIGSVVLYAGIRLVGMIVLALGVDHAGRSLAERLLSWDGRWFAQIAEHGYPGYINLTDVHDETSGAYAFLPGYPLLVRLVALVTGNIDHAGLAVTGVAGVVAAAGIYCYVTRLSGRIRVGVLAVGLWAALPMSVVLSMMYSEALFVALAVWALYAVLADRWLTAGVLSLCAGLVRPSGIALGVAVIGAAVIYFVRRRYDATGPRPVRVVMSAVLAVIGVPLWWVYVAIDTGRVDGWFAVQDFFWGSHLDFGVSFADGFWDAVTFVGIGHGSSAVGYIVNFAAVAGLLMALIPLVSLVVRAVGDARWAAPMLYALVLLGMAIGSAGYLHSKLRFLVPIFPIVIPVAIVLMRTRRVTATLVLISAVLLSAWWGAFMLLVWPYAI
ncbi:dolichyl-phosphate-mannose-protein mannosyltransferase [Antricoccus suffuscus]|uniref:Dolichyl-phosphate-mannose-protein mannosyltransferase n=1 Tax=Antricoccus suffuscus TaxID=1629062 RepID=A0A2T1A7S9_9ACTN|nr:glycosyltransferase family 39 protein [Antricoccus suffuscus]PRZ44398.1 dolichyl-phosphate-mannose-protein mannosyltransferase [Antricoccus suffuscus]